MNRLEATKLKFFKNTCSCGGYAHSMNGRPESQPHMNWCPQYDEYGEWWRALNEVVTDGVFILACRCASHGPYGTLKYLLRKHQNHCPYSENYKNENNY